MIEPADTTLDADIRIDSERVGFAVLRLEQMLQPAGIGSDEADEVLIRLVERRLGTPGHHRRQWQRATRAICDAFRPAVVPQPPETRAA